MSDAPQMKPTLEVDIANVDAVFDAVRSNNIDAVQRYLSEGTMTVAMKDDRGENPLYYACLLGHTALVQLLVDNGARDDEHRRCYRNALDRASLPPEIRVDQNKKKKQPKPMQGADPTAPKGSQLTKLKEKREQQSGDMMKMAEKQVNQTHISMKGAKWATRWEEFFETLATNEVAIKLDIRKSRMGTAGAEYLAKCLRGNTTRLSEIFMYLNEVGDAGAAVICESLLHNRYLKKLNLCDNLLTKVSAKAFGDLLRSPQCVLTYLDLNRNPLGDEGAAELAQALKENQTLVTLSVRGNGIGDDGANSFLAMLQHNTTMEHLYLQENEVSSTIMDAIATACKQNLDRKNVVLDQREQCADGFAVMFGECEL